MIKGYRSAVRVCFLLLGWSLSACNQPARQHISPLQDMPTNVVPQSVQVFTTAKETGQRLAASGSFALQAMPQPLETQIAVFVDPQKTYQPFLGIGGAITDASAETFHKLPAPAQQQILKAYFDPNEGIGYSLVRTTIHSSDFSSASYTYIKEGDASLASFDIAPDQKYRIPLIRKALETAPHKLTIYVSPWSPPAFMKDNNNMLRGGKLKPEYFQSWANYYVRFIKAYEAAGIPIWGLTVQNEPMATQKWESSIYTAEEERDFLKNFLGPTLKNAGLGDKKIMVWDHNRDLMFHRANVIFKDPEASQYAWGMGFHWYENWSGGQPMYENVRRVHEAFPDKHLVFTEGTAESFDPAHYGDWELGEKYARSMIHDFNNGTEGWTDWNILLDETGGPNHVKNFCFAPIHGNIQTGEVIFTNTYYYIGHFSKFIQSGAKRVGAVASRSQLLTTAFRNPDGKTVVVVMNQSNEETPYFISTGTQAAQLQIPARAIQTLILQ